MDLGFSSRFHYSTLSDHPENFKNILDKRTDDDSKADPVVHFLEVTDYDLTFAPFRGEGEGVGKEEIATQLGDISQSKILFISNVVPTEGFNRRGRQRVFRGRINFHREDDERKKEKTIHPHK